jgi:phosphoribosylanthranilate isomerase
MKTRIIVCGITNLEDALMCAELGVDAITTNFPGKIKASIK